MWLSECGLDIIMLLLAIMHNQEISGVTFYCVEKEGKMGFYLKSNNILDLLQLKSGLKG